MAEGPGASMISFRPTTADSGYPAASAFASTTMSGSNPKCSDARNVPARPRHGEERSAVEAALEAEDGRPPGGGPGELHRVLHRLGPRVEQGDLAIRDARQFDQPLGELDIGLVGDDGEVGVGDLGRLL